jgi:flagellar biosynthesis/type III secretory pathway protein FliH
MALVRHAHAHTIARDAIVLDLGDLARQGEALRARAHAEAQQIVANGKAERARLIEGAEAKGYAEGYARGQEEGRALGAEEGRAQAIEDTQTALAPLAEAWRRAIDDFELARSTSRQAAERDLVVLASDVARRVTHQVVSLHAEVVCDQLRHVLALVLDPSVLIVEVHPDDIETSRAILPGLLEGRGAGDVVIREGHEIARGSVIVRTRGGSIDASIDGQLDRIVEAMLVNDGGDKFDDAGPAS